MSAHTPGPWLVILTSTGEWQVFADKYNVIICDNVWDHTANKTGNSIEANARLIAAAPDLLEALELLMYRSEIHDPKMLAIAHAAIDKARGSA